MFPYKLLYSYVVPIFSESIESNKVTTLFCNNLLQLICNNTFGFLRYYIGVDISDLEYLESDLVLRRLTASF